MFTSKRKFGVELEVGSEWPQEYLAAVVSDCGQNNIVYSGWKQSSNNPVWHIKRDSSCGVEDFGWEVASPVSCGERDLLQIALVAAALGDAGVMVNNNCGFHIHVEVNLPPPKVGLIMAQYLKIEPWLCLAVPSRRVANPQCRLWHTSRKVPKDKKITAFEVWKKVKPTNYSPHENEQRRFSLNLVNYAESVAYERGRSGYSPSPKKTLEFRMPEGTLEPTPIIYWTTFFVNFIDHASKQRMPKNLNKAGSLKQFFKLSGMDSIPELRWWYLNRCEEFSNINSTLLDFELADE